MGRKKGQKEKVLEEEEDREEQLRIVPRLFALQPSTGGGESETRARCFLHFFFFSFGARQTTETPSILDFFIRFLSSRMRFKRNGSYTLNR